MNLGVEHGGQDPTEVVLLWPPDAGALQHQVQAFILMRRPGGVLVAVPDGVIEEESFAAWVSTEDGTEPLVGPSRVFQVPMWVTGEMGSLVIGEGLAAVRVLDMSLPGVGGLLQPMGEDLEFDLMNLFQVSDPGAHPDFQDLLSQVRLWIDTDLGERSDFYTADEAEIVEAESTPKTRTRARGPGTNPGGTTEPGKAPSGAKQGQKKPTVAGLAQQLEVVMSALPMITDQLTNLATQQAVIQKQMGTPPAPSTAEGFRAMAPGKASMPISSMLARPPLRPTSSLAGLVGPPPKTKGLAPIMPAAVGPSNLDGEPWEPVDEMEADRDVSPVAKALLEQSKALAMLVSHFHVAGSDPFADLSSSTPTMGVKGTAARERMQRELAQGSGQFFVKVCQSIQRRMSPTSKLAANLTETGDVSLLAYLERYGGYGQNRELGMVQWSLGHVFDAMAKGDTDLAKDHLALTVVMVEQAAVDNNRWQLAWLLRLLDDPPQNLWINRGQTATGSKRPFAPMAPQTWTTTALAYLKEADLLTSKKSEVLGNQKTATDDAPSAKPAPKRKPGKGGKGNHAANQNQAASSTET